MLQLAYSDDLLIPRPSWVSLAAVNAGIALLVQQLKDLIIAEPL